MFASASATNLEEFKQLLAREFSNYGCLSTEQLELLSHHFELMMRWNTKLNLTRITELKEVVQFHYCESLFLALQLPQHPLRIVDVGAGAGFPGIPTAVMRPDCRIDLVESHQRKVVFLREATGDLGNVRVLPVRAEDCQERYDWCISRAVRPEDVLKFGLAPDLAILCSGTEGTKLPWGRDRRLQMFHVKQ
jgi:16S rRNA (guanine527-N7)-methyltransferase